MSEMFQWIRKDVASGLQIYLSDITNLSRASDTRKPPKFYVGEDMRFDVMIRNNNSYALTDLSVTINEVEAVAFNEVPHVAHYPVLAAGQEKKVATVEGYVRKNADDAKSAWRFLDNVCRVTMKGQVDLPPIKFEDEEFEVVHVEDA